MDDKIIEFPTKIVSLYWILFIPGRFEFIEFI